MENEAVFMKKLVLSCAFAVLFLVSAQSSDAAEPRKHPILQEYVVRGEADVEYLGYERGLHGWLVRSGTQVQYAYQNDQGALIMGILFGDDAKQSITERQLRDYRKRQAGEDVAVSDGGSTAAASADGKPPGGAKAFYEAVEDADWVRLGDATAPVMYVFINPTCQHCKEYWEKLEPSVEKGILQVRLVPFGRLESNRVSSAALLSVDDPGAAWRAWIDGDEDALAPGKVADGALEKVDANSDLATKWALPMPPFSIYRSPADDKIKAIVGIPENMMLMMADFAL